MALKVFAITFLFLGSALSTAEPGLHADGLIQHDLTGDASADSDNQAIKAVFFRSDTDHDEVMDEIMKTMTTEKAWQVLQEKNMTTPALVEIRDDVLGNKKNLRKPPRGYAGLEGARKLLNDMIYESMSKYDAEIAKCTEYYSTQCGAMEACRGQIAASNFIAANSRSLILDAQGRINRCEVDIPTRKQELKQHNAKCARELKKMKHRLAIILGDIEIMIVILKMTDCDAKKLLQSSNVLKCADPCSKNKFITFQDKHLRKEIKQLQSTTSSKLVQDTFADLFDGVESMESVELVQTDGDISPIINKTKFNNPPLPRTEVPMNPCNDPHGGAPSAATKRAAKCALGKGMCYKLQERFLLIMAGIKDDRDALLEDIASMEHSCQETKASLEAQIKNDQDTLSDYQTKLGTATEKEAQAGEIARQTAAENAQLDADLKKQMKRCQENYIGFETEVCALKKIRGELMKMKGDGHSGFFQDCEVSKWDPEECTKKCHQKGGEYGNQKLTRNVITHPNGGTRCLPLAAMRKCNQQPCPIDCSLGTWSGWSKCSADCGGGVQQRLREVKRAMKYGGKPCGSSSETKSCNAQACEKDCELSSWTRWSHCSKDCDGGTRKRQKFIKRAPEGAGKCAGTWSPERLQFKACNMKHCFVTPKKPVIECNKSLDVLLLLDGSGSLGTKGWKAEVKAAEMFVDAFSGAGAQTHMAAILYSGPRTWSGVRQCTGKSNKKVDMEKTCKVKMITHFTGDMKKVRSAISGLTWPKGSTLTSLALATAKAELALGRKTSKSIVVVFTDGRPLSFRNTGIASRNLRKSARLVWVPVTKLAPLKQIKGWATRRWQENVVQVNTFEELEKPDPVNHIIANICPTKSQQVKLRRKHR